MTKSAYTEFDELVREWAESDKECRRLYILWNEACARQRKLARAKNRAWVEINADRVISLAAPTSVGAA